jgi:chemotaxis protein methyltransferase CheR
VTVNPGTELELRESQFEAIRRILHRTSGIDLSRGKAEFVRSRLLSRLRELGLTGFDEYLERVERDATGREAGRMIESLTTNRTSFFREPYHLDFVCDRLLPGWRQGPVRIWSAGCSSGEEPYSLAIRIAAVTDGRPRLGVRILATDISQSMVEAGRRGEYPEEALGEVPERYREAFFRRVRRGTASVYRVHDAARRMVRFARLNLVGPWPMRGPFDLILCRNVLIYFDDETRSLLFRRFAGMLKPGGHLLLGHSESLDTRSHPFDYVQPTVYRRREREGGW